MLRRCASILSLVLVARAALAEPLTYRGTLDAQESLTVQLALGPARSGRTDRAITGTYQRSGSPSALPLRGDVRADGAYTLSALDAHGVEIASLSLRADVFANLVGGWIEREPSQVHRAVLLTPETRQSFPCGLDSHDAYLTLLHPGGLRARLVAGEEKPQLPVFEVKALIPLPERRAHVVITTEVLSLYKSYRVYLDVIDESAACQVRVHLDLMALFGRAIAEPPAVDDFGDDLYSLAIVAHDFALTPGETAGRVELIATQSGSGFITNSYDLLFRLDADKRPLPILELADLQRSSRDAGVGNGSDTDLRWNARWSRLVLVSKNYRDADGQEDPLSRTTVDAYRYDPRQRRFVKARPQRSDRGRRAISPWPNAVFLDR